MRFSSHARYVLTVAFLFTSNISAFLGYSDPHFSNNFGIPGVNETFDYVIIGGGTAGLAIAKRLAENPSISVAVVEAGGFYETEDGNRTVVPGYYQNNVLLPSTGWNFYSTPQPQLLPINATLPYSRGRSLGGTSGKNAMIYQRATVGSFDVWADLVGDDSYRWEEMLPYYVKSSNYTTPNMQKRAANASVPAPSSEAFNATGGPLAVTYTNWAAPFSSWAQKAMIEIGVPAINDFMSGNLLGSQYCPVTVRPDSHIRETSEASYLQTALANKQYNLKVYTHSMAERILFDSNKTATGVLARTGWVGGNMTFALSARKEVILSAGAFQSPMLLMVSGIGPADTLSKFNIPVISNLTAVGKNMDDHVLVSVSYEVNVQTPAYLNDPVYAYNAEQSYLANQTGVLAGQNADFLGWEKVPAQYRANFSASTTQWLDTFPADWPDYELIIVAFNHNVTSPKSLVQMSVALISPESRGAISINSSSMDVPPLIDIAWLRSKTDQELIVAALKRGRDFWAAGSLKPVIIGNEQAPGANVTTDEQLLEYAKANVNTVYHASCTCAMGRNSSNSVIDSKARVWGVQNLRVVDASSFPVLVPGHPQSTIYALAEKIAADILRGNGMRSGYYTNN